MIVTRKYETKLPYKSLSLDARVDPEVIRAYRIENDRVKNLFKAELEKEFGVTNNPKRTLLFEIAWERGRASGYQEVAFEYDTLVDLIK